MIDKIACLSNDVLISAIAKMTRIENDLLDFGGCAKLTIISSIANALMDEADNRKIKYC